MNQAILIDIDSILDTRLATLIRMDSEQARLALTRDYRSRESDQWKALGLEIDQAEYQRRYAERDEETLKVARPTNAAVMLNEMTNALGKAALSAPMIERISVDVNVHPYRLSEQVKAMIAAAVNEWVSVETRVKVVDVPLQDVTPEYIDRHYASVVLYDFNEWLTCHHSALGETPIPTVTFIAPSLYLDAKPTEKDLMIEGAEKPISAFAALELSLIEYLSLSMMDARYFSLIDL